MDEQICNDYKENFLTIAELIKKYNRSSDTIRKILKEHNVHIRSQSENAILKRVKYKYTYEEIEAKVIENYCEKGYGLLRSGKEFGLTDTNVKSILKNNNISIRNFSEAASLSNENRSFFKNENFFDTESHDMAWLLGFMASDGNVRKDRNEMKIGLSAKDEEILQKIKVAVQIENNIGYYTTSDGFDVCELRWTCKEHKEKLKEYGIIPNKTFQLFPPTKLARKYWIDYIRGYFDGDGSINLIHDKTKNGSLRWQICSANPEILQWMIDYLYEDFNIPKVNIQSSDKSRKNPIYFFQYSTNATRAIYKILYNDSFLFLKRKKEHFEEILNKTLCE